MECAHTTTLLTPTMRHCAPRQQSSAPSPGRLFNTSPRPPVCVSPSQHGAAATPPAQHMAGPGDAGTMPAADSLSPSTQPLTFAAFLDKMRQPAAADLVRAIKAFLTEMLTSPPNAEADALRVQTFLQATEASFAAHPLWSGASPDELEASGEALEKYVMTKLHHRTFGVVQEDVDRDKVLAARMKALQFLRPEHLDIPVHHRNEQSWLLAQKELQKINQYKAPRDKLVCLLNCCRVLNNMLNVSMPPGEAPPGADDFLPVLVYVLLRAQPLQLGSNLAYITRFRLAARLVSETAYFFTNLVSAAAFLEMATPAQFTAVDAAEFAHNLRAQGLPCALSEPAQHGFSDAAPTTPVAMALHGRQQQQQQQQQQQRGGGQGAGRAISTLLSPLQAIGNAFAMTSTESPQLLPSTAPVPQRAAASQPPVVTRWTVDELAAVGAAVLASEADGDGGAQLGAKYRFLGAVGAPQALTLGDVAPLLAEYGELAHKYEALLRGVSLMLDSSSGEGPQRPTAPPPEQPAQQQRQAADLLFSGLNLGPLDGSSASLDSRDAAGDASLMDQ